MRELEKYYLRELLAYSSICNISSQQGGLTKLLSRLIIHDVIQFSLNLINETKRTCPPDYLKREKNKIKNVCIAMRRIRSVIVGEQRP